MKTRTVTVYTSAGPISCAQFRGSLADVLTHIRPTLVRVQEAHGGGPDGLHEWPAVFDAIDRLSVEALLTPATRNTVLHLPLADRLRIFAAAYLGGKDTASRQFRDYVLNLAEMCERIRAQALEIAR